MKFSRRQFIKASAVAAALATAGCGVQQPRKQDEVSGGTQVEAEKWYKAVCRYCGTGCGVMVGVKDGKVVAVKGDKDNEVNKGLLCAKAYYLPQILTAKDRLTKPLIRRNGKFVEATWDEALDLVAEKFREYIDKYGPDSVGFYGSGQAYAEEEYVANKLFKGAIGTNNVEGNPRLCMASAVGGYITTFGLDEPMGAYADFEHADVFFIIGSNMAECHPILFNRVTERKYADPNVKIIYCDPRKQRSMDIADIVVNFKPGTDLALLNAMAQVIVEEDLVDHEFVKKHTKFMQGDVEITFDQFKQFLQEFTPEKAEKICGVPAREIRKIARIFAEPGKNSMSLWTMGINQRVAGVWANNLIHNLHLLTGKICKPGSTPLSLTGQPSACGSVREVGALSHMLPAHRLVKNPKHREEIAKIWGVAPEKISPKPGYHTMEMFRAAVDGRLKALWVMCTNPAQSLPNATYYHQGLEKVFLVVSEAYHPTLTSQFADVVLPAALWVEKEGIYGNTERRTQHVAKAVDPPGEAKPDVWILMEFAKRLGYGHLFPYKSNEDIWNEYLQCTAGTDMELASYEDLKKAHGIQWPVPGQKGQKGTVRRYVAGEDPYVKEGIEFYGKPDGRAIIFARPYKGAAEEPNDEYPFTLTTGRVLEHWHTATMTGKCPTLNRAQPHSFVEINPVDASKLGIKDGDLVKITSRRGQVVLPARIGRQGLPQEGLLFATWFEAEKLTNAVTIDAFDPGSKEPEFKLCAVKIEKV
ncbi:MAG: molybdopterin-dependent oxidoreductase [Thermoanaerobacteraceae bacterium]|nr:molybdopterin-dependent oxidoreductase [Thermoanaerobacteraceae bacterium]